MGVTSNTLSRISETTKLFVVRGVREGIRMNLKTFIIFSLFSCVIASPQEPKKIERVLPEYNFKEPKEIPLTDYERHKIHVYRDGIMYNSVICKWCRTHQPILLQNPNGVML